MTIYDIVGVVLLILVPAAVFGVKYHTKNKLEDIDGFCGVVKPHEADDRQTVIGKF